jgi:hypothetical protein
MPMSALPHRLMFQTPEQGRIALVLAGADGESWTVTMSPGIDRFIGRYPRLESIAAGDSSLLAFRPVDRGC